MSLLLNKSVGAVSGHATRRGARMVARAEMPFDPTSVVGDKLGRWMQTPFDFMTFGLRASAGALVSAPQRLQTLQTDIERAIELVQDPRPITEKQTVLFQELEDTVVEFLERGADVEADVLANIKTVLPVEAANMLSEIIPPAPSKQSSFVQADSDVVGPPQTYYREDVAASQIASEIAEIKHAVEGLKAALEGIRSNTDPAQINIVRINLKEARDTLARRLSEVSGHDDGGDTSVAAATREAGILLDEVNAQFFTSS